MLIFRKFFKKAHFNINFSDYILLEASLGKHPGT